MKQEVHTNEKFKTFMDSRQQHPWKRKLTLDTFLKAPIHRLQRYKLLLAVLRRKALHSPTVMAIDSVDQALTSILLEFNLAIVSGERILAMQPVLTRLGSQQASNLNLTHRDRTLLRQGRYPVAGLKVGSRLWTLCDVFLLDNALLVALEHPPQGAASNHTVSHNVVRCYILKDHHSERC